VRVIPYFDPGNYEPERIEESSFYRGSTLSLLGQYMNKLEGSKLNGQKLGKSRKILPCPGCLKYWEMTLIN
jgi:hypothetical protein